MERIRSAKTKNQKQLSASWPAVLLLLLTRTGGTMRWALRLYQNRWLWVNEKLLRFRASHFSGKSTRPGRAGVRGRFHGDNELMDFIWFYMQFIHVKNIITWYIIIYIYHIWRTCNHKYWIIDIWKVTPKILHFFNQTPMRFYRTHHLGRHAAFVQVIAALPWSVHAFRVPGQQWWCQQV